MVGAMVGATKGACRVGGGVHTHGCTVVSALSVECLLAGGDGGGTDLSRKVQQRAAVLVGADDDDRLQVRNTVGAGYAARSAYGTATGRRRRICRPGGRWYAES